MNPWATMTVDDGRAYDERKENGPLRLQVSLKRALLWDMITDYLMCAGKSPILDLGGGTGIWSIQVARQGYPVILTDISPGLLERAKEKIDSAGLRHLVTTEVVDICDLGRYPEGSFGLVLALGDPLSYCGDAKKALGEIRRVIRPGGVLIGDVENRYRAVDSRRASGWDDVRRVLQEGKTCWPGEANATSIQLLTPSELRGLLADTGWRVEAMCPSDLLSSLLGADTLQQYLSDKDTMCEATALEKEIRDDQHLLGCGSEIQFIASKSSKSILMPDLENKGVNSMKVLRRHRADGAPIAETASVI